VTGSFENLAFGNTLLEQTEWLATGMFAKNHYEIFNTYLGIHYYAPSCWLAPCVVLFGIMNFLKIFPEDIRKVCCPLPDLSFCSPADTA
jgi:hypothetical protein